MRSATIKRCSWVSVDDPLMLQYHDHEWGVPVHKGPDAAVAGSARITEYSEVMDFSVEHGYRYLGIVAGNEEPVCQFKLFHQGVHLLLQKQARPGLNPYIETLSGKRVCLMFIIQIRSDDNFRVADNTSDNKVLPLRPHRDYASPHRPRLIKH